jgi:mannose-6-phosphate isomerase-like protein (cupin superfamily)
MALPWLDAPVVSSVDPNQPSVRAALQRDDAGILDLVKDSATAVKRQGSASDRVRRFAHCHTGRRQQTEDFRRVRRSRQHGREQGMISHTHSPGGWEDTAQCPALHEFTLILQGMVRVECADGAIEVEAGQAVDVAPEEWVRYSTPGAEGAEYVVVCMPAFSRAKVRRE